jgi:hypothetical protein
MRLQKTLTITFPIIACFNNCHLVVSFVILRVDSNSTIEPNELICGRTSFDLDDDRKIIRISIKVGNSNKVNRTRAIPRVNANLMGIVPANLPILCRVEAHFANIVRVQRISHETGMISVCCTI